MNRLKARVKSLRAYESSALLKDKSKYWCETCHRSSDNYSFEFGSVIMGLGSCMSCIGIKEMFPMTDKFVARYKNASKSEIKNMTMIAFDIETEWGNPFEITHMAMVDSEGLDSIRVERMNAGGWSIMDKREGEPMGCYMVPTMDRALTALLDFCQEMSKGDPKDVVVVMHNGVGFDLPVFMNACKVERVKVPEFKFLDTLVLSYLGKFKRSYSCSLRALFEHSFPDSTSYKAHCAYDDACMTMMLLWTMLESKASNKVKILQQVRFTDKSKIAVLCMYQSSTEYMAKHLKSCTTALADSFECKVPTKHKVQSVNEELFMI